MEYISVKAVLSEETNAAFRMLFGKGVIYIPEERYSGTVEIMRCPRTDLVYDIVEDLASRDYPGSMWLGRPHLTFNSDLVLSFHDASPAITAMAHALGQSPKLTLVKHTPTGPKARRWYRTIQNTMNAQTMPGNFAEKEFLTYSVEELIIE